MPETKSTHSRWWTYCTYFFYLAWGWNIRLAWFVIWRELTGEKTIGHFSSGIDTLKASVSEADLEHASIYQPVNFFTAEKLFQQLAPAEKHTAILDAGCGMGRVIALAAYEGFREIHGFDISAEMVFEALKRTDYLKERYPDTICHTTQANALHYVVPTSVGVVFLFNPFDALIMQGFVVKVLESLQSRPRPMTILYANPVHKVCWLEAGFVETYHFKKMTYLEGSVLRFNPNKKA